MEKRNSTTDVIHNHRQIAASSCLSAVYETLCSCSADTGHMYSADLARFHITAYETLSKHNNHHNHQFPTISGLIAV